MKIRIGRTKKRFSHEKTAPRPLEKDVEKIVISKYKTIKYFQKI